MIKGMGDRVLWSLAAIALVCGAGLTVATSRQIADNRTRLERVAGDFEKLQSLKKRIGRYEAARQAFDQLPSKRPVPFDALFKEDLAGLKFDNLKEDRSDAGSGWIVRRQDIALREVPLAKAMSLIAKAEAQRPPWRLARISVQASPLEKGSGRVELRLEALEKKE
jgi:hypothetical protein